MVAVAFTRIEWEAYPSEALNYSRMLDTKARRKFKLRNLRPLSLINHFRLKYKLPCSFTNHTTDRFGPGSIVQRRICQSVPRLAFRPAGSAMCRLALSEQLLLQVTSSSLRETFWTFGGGGNYEFRILSGSIVSEDLSVSIFRVEMKLETALIFWAPAV